MLFKRDIHIYSVAKGPGVKFRSPAPVASRFLFALAISFAAFHHADLCLVPLRGSVFPFQILSIPAKAASADPAATWSDDK